MFAMKRDIILEILGPQMRARHAHVKIVQKQSGVRRDNALRLIQFVTLGLKPLRSRRVTWNVVRNMLAVKYCFTTSKHTVFNTGFVFLVPANTTKAECAEPKPLLCGEDQIRKLEKRPDGCHDYVCGKNSLQ